MIFESSLTDLYKSAVEAFPKTTKRQHAVDPIVIKELNWTPFVGMKTMFIKGLAHSQDHLYNTLVLLRKVNYQGDDVRIVASDGLPYSFEKLSLENTDVSVRCDCSDYKFRFAYYNHLDKSLYGNKPKKYESKGIGPPANPMEMPGLCKHLMKTMKILQESGIFSE